MNLTKDSVLSEKSKLQYPSMIFLDGKYQKSSSGKTFENISPINGKTINQVVFSQKEDVDKAAPQVREVLGGMAQFMTAPPEPHEGEVTWEM